MSYQFTISCRCPSTGTLLYRDVYNSAPDVLDVLHILMEGAAYHIDRGALWDQLHLNGEYTFTLAASGNKVTIEQDIV